ncbi:hypothetical protein [Virgibacillus litoralis]|uniref:Uncharacterized protein n=1 Tax=Virgibacillus litoralis TaxID=578221 RepID=A0ABS4HFY4_9BACI|nr:hypothetical protein [Virgibacillus litoralis]MBP1949337.1 hypothetical protein [Virgibacillus litoralis]
MKAFKIILSISIIGIFLFSTKAPLVSAEDDYPDPLNVSPIDYDC